MTNPYIELERQGTVHAPYDANDSLAHALAFNERTIKSYEAKVVEDWQRQHNLTNWSIGVATVTVAAALGNAHRDVFKAIAGTAAATYQFSRANQNASRVDIYLDTIKALMCARSVAAPLFLSKEALKEVEDARAQYQSVNAGAARAIGSTSEALASPEGTRNLQTLQAELALLKSEAESAAELYKEAAGIRSTIDATAEKLNEATLEINRLTVVALKTTQAKPIELADAIKGVAASAVTFNTAIQEASVSLTGAFAAKSPAIPAVTANKESGAEAPDLSPADKAVATALDKVSEARYLLLPARKRLVGALSPKVKDVGEAMKGCGTIAPKPLLVLEPDALVLEVGQEQSVSQKYSFNTLTVTQEQGSTPGLSIAMTPDGRSFNVKADKAKPGVYVLKVKAVDVPADAAAGSDGAAAPRKERLARLIVTVNGDLGQAVGGTSGTKEGGPRKGTVCDELHKLSHTKACYLQSLLRVDVDGRPGPKTCAAFARDVGRRAFDTTAGFEIFARQSGLRASSSDEEFRKRLGSQDEQACFASEKSAGDDKKKTAPSASDTSAADKLSAAQVKKIAEVLGQPAVTDWRQLGDALMRDQNANRCKPDDGKLTEKEIARLLSEEPKKCL